MTTLEQARIVSGEYRELLGQMRDLIQGFTPSATVLLYGSVARGTSNSESDYDLLVLTAAPLALERQDSIRDALYDFQMARDVLVCVIFRTKAQWDSPVMRVSPFHKEVERDAIVL